VHDGIHLDRAGIPAATICTDHFVATSQATATIWGVPDYPVISMPHPLSTLTDEALHTQGQRLVAPAVRVLLTGSPDADRGKD
jgi:hypothetical protein